MKKLTFVTMLLLLLFSAAACSSNSPAASNDSVAATADTGTADSTKETEAPTIYQAPFIALSSPSISEKFYDGDTVIFTYTYQNLELTLEDPHVSSDIVIDFLNRVDYDNSSAPSILSDAKSAYHGQDGWIPYSFSTVYSPMRLDQSVLSLFGTQVIFNGSPRPTAVDMSLTYDLLTGRILELEGILNADYSADTLADLIIEALSGHANEGILYSDYAYVISEMFSTNTPINSWYFSQNGLCFYFVPYEIAPYSAGTIIAEIPYEKLTGLMKDEYFPGEEVEFTGSIRMDPFQDTDHGKFSSFAELLLDEESSEYLLHTDGAVRNIRLEFGTWLPDGSFTPAATVFAAASLCTGDALMLQASDATLQKLRLTYESDGTVVSVDLTSLIP